jgi:hypothetical protein
MGNINWPTNTKQIIDKIRGAIGRPTYWYIVTDREPCPVCDLDPITNTATDSFCPVCSGNYWLNVYSGVLISGHVTWGFSERLNWVAGGQLQEGECRVSIEYIPENVTVVDKAIWVEVDGRKMEISKRQLRGVPEINRILVDLKERDK